MQVDRDDGEMVHEGAEARIVFRLSPRPDEHWAALFGGRGGGAFGGRMPDGYSHKISMSHPELNGDLVTVAAPTGQIEEYIAKLDERIDATNAQYLRDIVPLLEQQREAREKAREVADRNLATDTQALADANKRRRQQPPG